MNTDSLRKIFEEKLMIAYGIEACEEVLDIYDEAVKEVLEMVERRLRA